MNREELSEDLLLGGRVRLLQPRTGFRAALEPVLMAAAVPARPGQCVLDAGAGTGAAALCLAARVPGCTVLALESEPAAAALAQANATAGVAVCLGDLADPPPEVRGRLFDHVMTNPPFFEAGRSRPPADARRRAARVEGEVPLDRWLALCLARLRGRGTITVAHRAARLDDLMAALAGRAGGIAVLPLWPRHGQGAKMVIVQARKGSRAPARLLPGLALHEENGSYTAAAQAVLRDAAALHL